MTEEYQKITLIETHEELIVSTTEYPLQLAGIFYIKFIVYHKKIDHIHYNKTKESRYIYIPINFVTLLPQNILKRENIWSQEEEDLIKSASQEAKDREKTMVEYRKAAEEEMKKRSQEVPLLNNKYDPIDPTYM